MAADNAGLSFDVQATEKQLCRIVVKIGCYRLARKIKKTKRRTLSLPEFMIAYALFAKPWQVKVMKSAGMNPMDLFKLYRQYDSK